VYNDYKLKLKSYGKKNLDPSLDSINIPLDDERVIETTIGQLNFFKWARDSDYRVYRGELRRDRDRRIPATARPSENTTTTRFT
jgi:hypothetical protein